MASTTKRTGTESLPLISCRYTAVRMAIGTAITVAIAICSIVPTRACTRPPPSSSGPTEPMSLAKNSALITPIPLMNT